MIGKIFLVSLLAVFTFANPYEKISIDEKLTLFTNYFINESLKEKLPQLPNREIPPKNEYNYEPTKYEFYYNYVQRIKAIEESIAEEQAKLDEKFEADIYKYNSKVKALQKFYEKEQNLYPIFTESFNKAIKVVYGKPVLNLKNTTGGIQFFLDTQAIYTKTNFNPKAIIFNSTKEKKMFDFYEKCDVSVTFKFNENILEFDEVICNYQDEIYQGRFDENNNEKIKLNLKINDDIFQQIKFNKPNGDNK